MTRRAETATVPPERNAERRNRRVGSPVTVSAIPGRTEALSRFALTLTVPGAPAPQGSKKHVGRGILIESSKAVGPWRERIAWVARDAMTQTRARTAIGAVTLAVEFVMPRPKSTPRATPPAVKRPDVDKLARAVLDALVLGGVMHDDSQVIDLRATKRLANPDEQAHARITVEFHSGATEER